MKGKFQLALLFVVFFISGFSALVYQVAWQRILTLYYSVENISTTLIVSVYMLGLGLGAILGGYFTEKIKNRITFYFFIELLIGVFGFLSIPFLSFLGKYTAGSSYFTSFLLMFAFLCIPTLLMGMTLPLLTKIFNHFLNNFLNSLSSLYFINTLGAAVGSLATSYLFISFWGLDTSVYLAATVNIIIAIVVFIGIRGTRIEDSPVAENTGPAPVVYFSKQWIIYAIVFITGFTAIGYEIIWFRIIGILVKASAYSFSSVLFIYLLGIAIGSFFMNKYLKRNPAINKKNLFAMLQVAISVFVIFSIVTYCYLVNNNPFFAELNSISFKNILHPIFEKPSFSSALAFAYSFFPAIDILFWPMIFVFIPTCCMGASFPLITSMAYSAGKEASTVGNVYFFNVLGNVAGGLFTGLLFVQVLGSEHTILLFSLIGMLFIFMYKGGNFARPVFKVAYFLILIVPGFIFFPSKNELYATTHPKQLDPNGKKVVSEGLDGIIVSYYGDDYLTTHINGISHGGRPGEPFYFRALLAMSYKKALKDVLVIGFGTGSMVEAILRQDPKPDITLVELNRTLMGNFEKTGQLVDIFHDKNVNLVYADGRKYLYNNAQKYDAVFIDPLYSTTSFSNNLYSKEFFSLVKDHLKDDGIFLVWSDETHVTPRTVCTVFPYVKSYGFFCVASKSALVENEAYKYQLFARMPRYEQTLLKFDSAIHTYRSRDVILEETAAWPINEDYKPRCEYYLGIKR